MAKFNFSGPVDPDSVDVVSPETVVRKPRFAGPADPDPAPKEETNWLDTVGQFSMDTLRNFNDTLTFGLYNRGLEATGIDPMADEKLTEANERNPYGELVGDSVGYILPGLGMSSAVARAAPALARNTLPMIMAREGTSAAALSATDDLIRDQSLNPGDIALDALLGAGISGGVAGIGRLSPSARVRAAGSDLTGTDKTIAENVMMEARANGVPLTVPEAVNVANRGNGVRVQSIWDDALQTPKGSQVAQRFEAAREGSIEQIGRDMVSDLGPGASPFEVSASASRAIGRNEDMVRESAQPYYDAANNRKLPPTWVPRNDPAYPEIVEVIRGDETMMRRLNRDWRAAGNAGDIPENSGMFQDAVKKIMDERAGQAFGGGSNFTGSIFSEGAETVRSSMDRVSPEYPVARDISQQGGNMVRQLEAGPLGQLVGQPTAKGQANTIFNVDTAVDADLSRRALAQLGAQDLADQAALGVAPDLMAPPTTPRSILANSIDSAVSSDPGNWANAALPSPHARGLAMGVAPDVIADARFRAASAVDPYTGQSLPGNDGSFLAAAQAMIRSIGKERIAKMMTDPATIRKLGITGPLQRAIALALSGAVIPRDSRAAATD